MCTEFYIVLICIGAAVLFTGLLLGVIFWELRKRGRKIDEPTS